MELEIIRSNRKSLGAEIKQGKLIIRAPIQATNEDINNFMLKNKKWIETHLNLHFSQIAAQLDKIVADHFTESIA